VSYVVVTTTAGSKEEARKIAGLLVDARLAACVQIVPGVTSVYRWKGRVEQDREWLLIAKTTSDLVQGIEQVLADHHSYDVPELVVTPVIGGSTPYLQWLGESVSGPRQEPGRLSCGESGIREGESPTGPGGDAGPDFPS
jgi:periplasmic divalent cation tolerance protein